MEVKDLLPYSLLIFCIIPVLLLVFSKLSNNKKKLPPGPKGLPIIGNLLAVGDRPHESLSKLTKTYGALMTVKLGMSTTVVASSPDMAREILLKNDQAFLGRPVPDAITGELDYEVTLAWISGGQQWKKLRKLCNTELFTTQRLDALRDLRHQMMENVIKTVGEARQAKEAISIPKLVFVTALTLLSNMIFSRNIIDPASPEVDELQQLIQKIMELAGKQNLSDVFPFLRPFDPQGIRRRIKVSYDRLRELVEMSIDERKNLRASKAHRNGDFLDALLDYSEQHGPQELNRRDIRLLLMEMFIGGTDTTATTLEWAMAELLHNPPVLAKAKQELIETFGADGFVKEQDVMKLPYLDAIVKETLRLHPTAPLLLPHSPQTDVQVCGFHIPKDTRVFINAWAISRDTNCWKNPTNLDPERFMGSEFDFRGRHLSFIPFGAGRRICPGLSLGTRMVSLLLATLVHNFDWKLPNGIAPEDLDMNDKFGVTLQKAIPLLAIPVKSSKC